MGRELPARVRLGVLDGLSKTLDKVQDKFPQLSRAVRRTSTAFDVLDKSTEKFTKKAKRFGSAMQGIGTTLTAGITLPVAAAGAFSVKAFADYETALTGVGKTTNLQGAELEALGEKFLDLSKQIPVSATELLGLGQTAAQLGVSGADNVLKFSEVLGKLARASDVTGEEGAAALARFITVTKGSIGDVDRFASALVHLGNTSAATESEILNFALRMGASTAIFNVTGQQALGIATALKSVGIEAEAGSSAVQRALGNINQAISKGGQKMQMLSKLTGISTDELKTRFKTDAAGVLRDFAAGLARVEEKGGDVSQALAFFGMTGVRDIQVIGALSKNVGLLDDKMKSASEAFKENSALNQEFAAQTGTLANRFQVFQNKLFAVGKVVGEKLKPPLVFLFDVLGAGLDFLAAHPGLTIFLGGLAALAAVVGPILLSIGFFVGTLLPTMTIGFTALTAVLAGFSGVLGTIGAVLGAINLPFILIGAAIVGLIVLLWKFRTAIKEGFVSAWDWALQKLDAFIEKAAIAVQAVQKFLGFNVSTPELTQAVTPGGAPVTPQGTAVGGVEAQARMNQEFSERTNNARVDINVRAPQSTSIVGESQGGFMSINRGLAGAF